MRRIRSRASFADRTGLRRGGFLDEFNPVLLIESECMRLPRIQPIFDVRPTIDNSYQRVARTHVERLQRRAEFEHLRHGHALSDEAPLAFAARGRELGELAFDDESRRDHLA